MNVIFEELESAQEKIIEQIMAIEKKAFGEAGLDYWTLVPIIRHGRVFILKNEGQVVAVAEYMRDFKKPATAYLYGLSVDEEFRGQGLAKQLLKSSHNKLLSIGIKKVTLTVAPDNKPACHLYLDKLGFSQYAYWKNEYGKGYDRLSLELILKEEE